MKYMINTDLPITMSNIQLELLRLYSKNISDSELQDIRLILARYFMQKAVAEATILWEQKDYDQQALLNDPS
jgi:hypothetical protein